jgi:hypothetical protein
VVRFIVGAWLALALVLGSVAGVAAQEPGIDISFTDAPLRELGLPEVVVTVGEDGIDAPSSLAEGFYLITLTPTKEYSTYLNIMVPPAGLSEEDATQQALDAAAGDLALPTWKYLGGTNTFEIGVPVSFAIYLPAGEYVWAGSYYGMDQNGEDEIMTLAPLSVGGEATPAATPVVDAPVATVTLEMTDDLIYIVSPDPVPSGPQLWEVTNTGTDHAHHVVMSRIPEGVTADQIIGDFSSMFAGTPPAGEPIVAQFTYVGYTALQSGGQTTWQGFDLEPGEYVVICFIINHETGVPHLLDGMVTTFTVAD